MWTTILPFLKKIIKQKENIKQPTIKICEALVYFRLLWLPLCHIEYCSDPVGYSRSTLPLPLNSDHMSFLNYFLHNSTLLTNCSGLYIFYILTCKFLRFITSTWYSHVMFNQSQPGGRPLAEDFSDCPSPEAK